MDLIAMLKPLGDLWAFLLVLVGHIVRTETSRAVMRREIEYLSQQRANDMTRIEAMWTEVRHDIKLLLQRKRDQD